MFTFLNKPIVICDVETTGMGALKSRITEIACVRFENGIEVARFKSLVNPKQIIPFNIQKITGITPAMVNSAPTFNEIATQVAEIFNDAILCAHNAKFDHSFIRAELNRAGYEFNIQLLCSVKLSRNLYPQHQGHGLSAIINRFNLTCDDRHRAMGDVEALIQFLKQISKDHPPETILAAIDGNQTKSLLPPNLSPETIKQLPETPGVYTFLGKGNEILYIGKSVNIKSRVRSHFSNAIRDTKSQKIWREVYDISYELTASDLGAQLLEIHRIKTLSPLYNRALRRKKQLWALRKLPSVDYTTFKIERVTDIASDELKNIYGIFKTKSQAVEIFDEIVKNNHLCKKLFGLEKTDGACFSHQLGICSGACIGLADVENYNYQVETVLNSYKVKTWPHNGAIEIMNDNNSLQEKFVIDNWILQSAKISNKDKLIPMFSESSRHFDYDVYKVLAREILKT